MQAPREARQPGRRTVPEPEPEPEPVSAPPPKPAAQAAPKPAAPPQPKPEKRKVSFKGAVKKQITAKTWAQDMIGEGFRQAVYDDLSEEDRAAADKLKAEQSREELTGSLRMAASAGKVRLPQQVASKQLRVLMVMLVVLFLPRSRDSRRSRWQPRPFLLRKQPNLCLTLHLGRVSSSSCWRRALPWTSRTSTARQR